MTGHTPWSEIKHKSDTKELVERVREALESSTWVEGDVIVVGHPHEDGLAALSELEARLARAESLEEQAWNKAQFEHDRAEAAERERDSWVASHIEKDKLLWAADARVAELEEALRFYADENQYESDGPDHDAPIQSDAGEIARAALDRAKEAG